MSKLFNFSLISLITIGVTMGGCAMAFGDDGEPATDKSEQTAKALDLKNTDAKTDSVNESNSVKVGELEIETVTPPSKAPTAVPPDETNPGQAIDVSQFAPPLGNAEVALPSEKTKNPTEAIATVVSPVLEQQQDSEQEGANKPTEVKQPPISAQDKAPMPQTPTVPEVADSEPKQVTTTNKQVVNNNKGQKAPVAKTKTPQRQHQGVHSLKPVRILAQTGTLASNMGIMSIVCLSLGAIMLVLKRVLRI